LKKQQLEELLFQALETERGGIKIYEAAVRCAKNDDLRKEWGEYLDQTRNHEVVMLRVLNAFRLDPETMTPGREIVQLKGMTLVESMERALEADPDAAQLVAAECVVEGETKDHMNWELMGEAVRSLTGDEAKVLKEAHEEVEEEEDEHLYHTMGWARELWLESSDFPQCFRPQKRRSTSRPRSEQRAPSNHAKRCFDRYEEKGGPWIAPGHRTTRSGRPDTRPDDSTRSATAEARRRRVAGGGA
jgi:rubrerythrin